MGSLRSRVLGWAGRRYLAWQSKKGFDLEKMSSFLPDAALLPLRRDSLDPVAEIGAIRAEAPISKLDLPFGMNAWLVTGYDEAKAVLGKVTEFSTDFTNLVGSAGGRPRTRTRAASASRTRPCTPGCASCSRPSSPCAGSTG